MKHKAFFAYADNYLIDTQCGIVMDVEATRAIRQAEFGASRTMIERTEQRFGITPQWLAGDTAYGSADNLGWLVNEKGIEPHVPVIDKSKRDDGTFSRDDFKYDAERDCYVCPTGADLTTTGRIRDDTTLGYLASVNDCRPCPLKERCCPLRSAKSRAASMRRPAMWHVRSLKQKPSKKRAANARRLRWRLPTSSAFLACDA